MLDAGNDLESSQKKKSPENNVLGESAYPLSCNAKLPSPLRSTTLYLHTWEPGEVEDWPSKGSGSLGSFLGVVVFSLQIKKKKKKILGLHSLNCTVRVLYRNPPLLSKLS
jgi:hypothetical protein